MNENQVGLYTLILGVALVLALFIWWRLREPKEVRDKRKQLASNLHEKYQPKTFSIKQLSDALSLWKDPTFTTTESVIKELHASWGHQAHFSQDELEKIFADPSLQ